jgi:CRISPR-associated protein Csb2
MRAVCISATFLNGCYHGSEWPAAPARLLQGMVACVKSGRHRGLWDEAKGALEWLERQPPPRIQAVEARRGQAYRIAVPNNDMDVVAYEWAAGRTANPADLKTMKTVQPYWLDGASEPHLRYLWEVSEDETGLEDLMARLRPLAHCLHTLGWGVDMSYADAELVDQDRRAGITRWVPSKWGAVDLATPVPGFITDLERTYQRFRTRASGVGADADTRPTVFRMQKYSVDGELRRPYCVFSLEPVPGDRPYSKEWYSTIVEAGRMRHTAAEVLRREGFGEEFVTSFVEGHDESDEPFRMSFVPLPWVGDEYADGRIRRAMFVEPAESDGEAVRMLTATLAGQAARDEEKGSPVFQFAERRRHDWVDRYYLGTSNVWRSVTPVVLHGFNSNAGKISLKKTDRLLYRAFEMAGYPADLIESLAFQAAPLWRGTAAAFHIRLPKHMKMLPRYHVEVRFRRAVQGPVLAGIGRHCGLGVFAAVR